MVYLALVFYASMYVITRRLNYIKLLQHEGEEKERLERYLENFEEADLKEMEDLLQEASINKKALGLSKGERKELKKVYREQLVKRSAIKKIITPWIVTVPCSAALAAALFVLIQPWIAF